MTARERLPQRRASETFAFTWNGMKFTASVSRFPDGRLAEIFLHAGKSETQLESLARDLAVTASLALQHGAPVAVLAKALTHLSDGTPAGPLGHVLTLLDEREGSQ